MIHRSMPLRHMLTGLVCLTLLAGCAVATGPDPREEFSARNEGKTVITYVSRLGTQAVYLAPGGGLHLWSSAGLDTQMGEWKYDILATGAATTYQGAGGINHPVQELETEWGICFRYLDNEGNVLRRPEGGDWNCALLPDYESLIFDRAQGDIFNLQSGKAPAAMPKGQRLTGSDLEQLG